jgi:hypothetical protein
MRKGRSMPNSRQEDCGKEVVPRARIGLATPAFSGPRSTNELPRHGSNLRFYGKDVALKRENGPHRWPG